MRALPLSAKVALWSFVLALVTIGGGNFVTAYVLKQEIMSVIEQRAARVSKDTLVALDHLPENLQTITKDMLPRSVAALAIEITAADGKTLYRAPSLKKKTLADGPATPHQTRIGKLTYYVETHEQRGLTLRLGLPLTQVETSLQRLKLASLVALPIVAVFSLSLIHI